MYAVVCGEKSKKGRGSETPKREFKSLETECTNAVGGVGGCPKAGVSTGRHLGGGIYGGLQASTRTSECESTLMELCNTGVENYGKAWCVEDALTRALRELLTQATRPVFLKRGHIRRIRGTFTQLQDSKVQEAARRIIIRAYNNGCPVHLIWNPYIQTILQTTHPGPHTAVTSSNTSQARPKRVYNWSRA